MPEITEEEKNIIIEAVVHHSEKNIKTENKYIELMKDIDSFDRYLHGIKSEEVYLERCNIVFKELNII